MAGWRDEDIRAGQAQARAVALVPSLPAASRVSPESAEVLDSAIQDAARRLFVRRTLAFLEERRRHWLRAIRTAGTAAERATAETARHEASLLYVEVCKQYGLPEPAWWGGRSPEEG